MKTEWHVVIVWDDGEPSITHGLTRGEALKLARQGSREGRVKWSTTWYSTDWAQRNGRKVYVKGKLVERLSRK